MTTTPTIWPRAYLLSIYAEAIKQGFVWIEPLTEAQATSLRMALYRLRRRADINNREFITGDHKLVTVGQYDPAGSRLPILFNRLPDMQLPSIVGASPEELASFQPLQTPTHAAASESGPPTIEALEILNSAAEIQLDESDITSYVEKMKRRASGKKEP